MTQINQAVIGLGSNINPEIHIPQAKEELAKGFSIIKVSEFIQTKPIGYAEQADFINGAVLLETPISLEQLRFKLQAIEKLLGRKKSTIKFGPRTIDLDVVVWNNKIIDQDFYTRDFLKKSVLQLIPNLAY